jgi:bifunctional non-homologous end joining protein LigD
MKVAARAVPFDDPGFIFELKYDGFRALAHVAGGECRLVSRNRNAFKTFPALSAAIAAAVPHQAVIDGEIVHLGMDGRPQFMS